VTKATCINWWRGRSFAISKKGEREYWLTCTTIELSAIRNKVRREAKVQPLHNIRLMEVVFWLSGAYELLWEMHKKQSSKCHGKKKKHPAILCLLTSFWEKETFCVAHVKRQSICFLCKKDKIPWKFRAKHSPINTLGNICLYFNL
jgi:hypothetical protein